MFTILCKYARVQTWRECSSGAGENATTPNDIRSIKFSPTIACSVRTPDAECSAARRGRGRRIRRRGFSAVPPRSEFQRSGSRTARRYATGLLFIPRKPLCAERLRGCRAYFTFSTVRRVSPPTISTPHSLPSRVTIGGGNSHDPDRVVTIRYSCVVRPFETLPAKSIEPARRF